MSGSFLQADIKNRGLVLDPRTKFLLLITMSVFVLGGAGGSAMQAFVPVFCAVPAVALLSAKKLRPALVYIGVYALAVAASVLLVGRTRGILNSLILGSSSIVIRFMPCIMMGSYLVSTTTVSEFTAAMQRLHLSEKIIIPLSVMFRFFPTVTDEFNSINAAMKMRDIRMGGKGFSKMIEYRIVPLMVCCVKIGEELSAAALTRGLGGSVRRTNICKIGFRVQDIAVMLLCAVPYIVLVLQFFVPEVAV